MFRIKELRESKGIKMKEAARLLEMPYTTYVNYEKGLREPTSEVLIQLADFFGVSIDFLVGRKIVDPQKRQIYTKNGEIISPPAEDNNIIKITVQDGSYQEFSLSDQQLADFQALFCHMPSSFDNIKLCSKILSLDDQGKTLIIQLLDYIQEKIDDAYQDGYEEGDKHGYEEGLEARDINKRFPYDGS